jgi:uncharacterized repeat protein (TIGR01451 family)
MEGKNGRRTTVLRWLALPAIALAVLTVFLTWDGPTQAPAEAVSGGPEMRLAVTGNVACPGGTPAGIISVAASGNFSLKVRVITAPAGGYILANSFIDYATYNPAASEDGAGPNTCSDGIDNGGGDGADRFDLNPGTTGNCVSKPLVYNPTAGASTEVVWPDCVAATALRSETGRGLVNHGCLTGLLPPVPVSSHTGDIVSLSMTCSAAFTTTQIQLLPEGDPVAGTSGALFVTPPNTQIVPKVSGVTVRCLGPTPTNTNTPPPATNTPTKTPTPTNTFTPLPPPSERPDVRVTKVDLADPVDSAANIKYQIHVTSVGQQTATSVKVFDTLPPGTTFVTYSAFSFNHGANCTHAAGVVTCNITGGGMAPGDEIFISITVTAPIVASDERISNLVEVTSTNEPFENFGNNKDIEETVILAPRADLTVQKVGEPTFVDPAPDDIEYTIVAINNGPHDAENVVVTDTLPPDDVSFVSASPECGAPAGGEVVCDLDTIVAGGQKIVTITLTALPVTRNTILKNSVFVSADNELFTDTGDNLATDNTPVVAPPPELSITKTDSADKVLRFTLYSYSVTVVNDGGGDALDVVVSDTLPSASVQIFAKFIRYATFISAVGADCEQVGMTNKITCDLGDVDANSQVKFTINVRAPTLLVSQTVNNHVTVSTSVPDEDPSDNSDDETTEIKACFDTNGDLVVDLPNDIFQTIQHYGLYSTDVGFDPIYDFDGDGFIGLANDILPVIQNYLQDCSLLLL